MREWNDPVFEIDPDQSLEEAIALAEDGDPSHQYNLGMRYLHADPENPEFREAETWLTRAATQRHSPAAFELARLYLTASMARGQDRVGRSKQAALWLHRAAELDHVDAQCMLACLYGEGVGVEKSASRAAAWFTRAAENGHVKSMYVLATMYDGDAGVPRDDEAAVHWCRKGAELGHIHSQYMLALRFARGYGVDIDQEQATAWANRALDQANANAEETLCRAKGPKETSPDELLRAYFYCSHLATARNDAIATVHMAALEKHMPADQVALAKEIAANFLTSFPPDGQPVQA